MNDQRPFSDSPIFIVGNPRSGTTLLRLMLTCHPNVAVPPEGKFIVDLYRKYRHFDGDEGERRAFARDVTDCPKMEYWNVDVQALDRYLASINAATYADLVRGVYEWYAAENHPGKRRWGDKNNVYLRHIPLLGRLFPKARFVHIVRDGRDVACSYRDLSEVDGPYAPDLPNGVIEAARHWRRNVTRIRRGLETIGWDRAYELRYEDLVTDVTTTLQSLCAFLDEPYSDAMLAFAEENAASDLEPRAFDAWKRRSRQALDPSRARRWRTCMFVEDVAFFERESGALLEQYGYETTSLRTDGVLRAVQYCYGAIRPFARLPAVWRHVASRVQRTFRRFLP